jgi:glycosyltransferase involved in cell wall biosynthesis
MDHRAKPRVLCLDIEGGRGGSSRSLYHLLRHIDRSEAEIEVWYRTPGMVEDWYADLNIPTRLEPRLPRFTAPRPGFREGLHQIRTTLPSFIKAVPLFKQWARELDRRFDVVHFNHPAFFVLASLLRRWTKIRFVMHIRTRPDNTALARLQARMILRDMDHLVFITENEQENLAMLGGHAPGSIIYNVPAEPANPTPHPVVPVDKRFKIASLSNYVWVRGLDRIVEVAGELAAMGRRDILFVMAGNMKLHKGSDGPLGQVAAYGGTLSDYVDDVNLTDMFLFTGHVAEPERIALACDATIKLTREYNPWGRDVIESLYLARPGISIGTWDRFLCDAETGILHSEYDAGALARDIIRLADDRDYCRRLGEAGRERISLLCNGQDRANDLLTIWKSSAIAQADTNR